jgi:hypothetical protein
MTELEELRFKSAKKAQDQAARPMKTLPYVKKDYAPKPFYQFLPKSHKDAVDRFDLTHLDHNLRHNNILNILWIGGMLADKIMKFPTAPINPDHQAVLEKIAQIFEEWGIMNEKLLDT